MVGAVVEVDIGVELILRSKQQVGVIEMAPASIGIGVFRTSVVDVRPGRFLAGDRAG